MTGLAKSSFILAVIPIVLLASTQALGVYAESIHEFNPGYPIRDSIAPIENILGPPDMAIHPWESGGSIGHLGAVVVDMGAAGFHDTPGDDIFLWFGGWTDTGYYEVVEGLIVEASIDGSQFHFVGELPKGNNVYAPVPPFKSPMDLAASGLSHARYLRISDTGTDRTYAGLELNAIEAVPEPATVFMLGLGSLAFLRKSRKRKQTTVCS